MPTDTGAESDATIDVSPRISRTSSSTRSLVLAAAARIFLEKGYADTTIQDIADALEMPKGSVYYHIGSKEAILHEILITGMRDLNAKLRDIASYPISAVDRLRLAIRDNLRASTEEIHAPVSVYLSKDIRFLEPDHYAEYIALRDEYESLFMRIVSDGITSGEFRDIPNAKVVLFGIFSLIGSLLNWYKEGQGLSVQEIADTWWDFVVNGLGAPA